jgi:hypothetical protein
MAITTRTPEGTHAEPTKEQARQGQNIKGMVTVLVVSLLLVAAAYGVMLALLGGGEVASDPSPAADKIGETGAVVQPLEAPPSN